MKKILFAVMLLFFTTLALLSEEGVKYVTGKITLVDGGNVTPEVYVYYNRFRNDNNNLIKVVKADKNGEFKIGIPKSINYADIQLAAPGYEAYMTKFIEGDKNPRVEATLHTRAIPEHIDSVGVLLFNNNSQTIDLFPIIGNSTADISIDLNEEKYETVKKKGTSSLTYTYLFNGSSNTPAEGDNSYEYDNNGDYNRVTIAHNDKLNLKVDLKKYRRTDDATQQSLTTGHWVNSPINDRYNDFLELMPTEEVANLSPKYYYFVMQKNKNTIKDLTPEDLEQRKQNTISQFYSYLKITDSLLTIDKSTYLNDYLKMTKLKILNAADTANKWDDYYKVLQSVQEIPTEYYSLFNDVVYSDEFKENPKKFIDILEENYDKSKDLRNRYYKRFGLYSTLTRTELVNDPIYKEYLIKNINEIIKYKNLDSWIAETAPKAIIQLNLSSMEFAPNFSFKSIDEKQYKLSDFKGKWVLLDFWGTWCGPCRGETPHLVKAYDELGGDKFEIISVSSDGGTEVLKDYIVKNKMKWTNTIELKGYAEGVLKQFGITAFPTLMLVNPDGKFVKVEQEELRGELLIPTLEAKLERE
ncbi:MAG: hypothetical protein CVV25_04185 [Ignavibacteriae bacterium HGW-Ignavibacteriae-4]|jgi:thiol-disulfide isomerase/thioredoxin|nr:MAG: hypothetical protein CVV25_04185 [Ignavibacteriae bacterium HGW-Ignavibacteriae-4]